MYIEGLLKLTTRLVRFLALYHASAKVNPTIGVDGSRRVYVFDEVTLWGAVLAYKAGDSIPS